MSMEPLEYIKQKYNINPDQKMPIELPMARHREMLHMFRELGFKVGAEIGTATGWFAKWICNRVPGVKLYCIDPWISYPEYVEHHNPEDTVLQTCLETAQRRLAKFDVAFIRKYSMDAVKDFEDNSLDFVFIDGNHSFEYVINDIAEWSKKVRVGGIISGHDYWRSIEKADKHYHFDPPLTLKEKIRLIQVKDAVDGWTKANEIRPWFITKGDGCSSWFWVKEE